MEERINLQNLTREISSNLVEAKHLLEALEELDIKQGTILAIALRNIKTAFDKTEKCREIISMPE
jgi:hypothetical protein